MKCPKCGGYAKMWRQPLRGKKSGLMAYRYSYVCTKCGRRSTWIKYKKWALA